jgi:hypothetical protein
MPCGPRCWRRQIAEADNGVHKRCSMSALAGQWRCGPLVGGRHQVRLASDVEDRRAETRLRIAEWLRIEAHQLHYLGRHAHFDRESQRARFARGERIITRPMTAS